MNRHWTMPVLGGALLMTASLGACSDAGGAAGTTDGGVSTTVPASQVATQALAYVDAVNKNDLDALVSSFDPGGEVVDVSRHIRGHDAIRTWARNEVMGGKLQVLEVTPMENGQDLLVHWAPSGSGGWRAHYRFTFAADRIAVADLQYA